MPAAPARANARAGEAHCVSAGEPYFFFTCSVISVSRTGSWP